MVTLAFSLFCVVLVLGIQQKANNPELDIASCMTDGIKGFCVSIKQLFIVIKASKSANTDAPEIDVDEEREAKTETDK